MAVQHAPPRQAAGNPSGHADMTMDPAEAAINKTMSRSDLAQPDCAIVLAELFGLMRRMQARDAKYSSWYGRVDAWPSAWEHINRGPEYEPWPGNPDELRIPWYLLWEIAWLSAHAPLPRGARVLDMGGAGSLFTSFLAARGHEVHTIDLDSGLCRLSAETARRMGWRIRPRQMDMTRLDFPDGHFDAVFSVCVFEHLPVSGRIACNAQVARVLRPGGVAAYTFDYANPQSFGRIDTPEDVHEQFVAPSALSIMGNARFFDTGERYLETPPCFGFGRFMRTMGITHSIATGKVDARRVLRGQTSYTMGAVFLKKPGS